MTCARCPSTKSFRWRKSKDGAICEKCYRKEWKARPKTDKKGKIYDMWGSL